MLEALEHLKAELGQNDAIEDEAAASAYVENFALKVFAMADNEDRRGEATRCVPLFVPSAPLNCNSSPWLFFPRPVR